MLEVTPLRSENASAITGTSDDLEFDPTSIPPPDFDSSTQSAHSPSGRPPRRDASMGASISLHPLNVLPLDVPSLGVPALKAPGAAVFNPAPRNAEVRAAVHSVPPGAGLPAFPGMANELDLGEGLDDLDFGDAAASQLNVATFQSEEGYDVPWPLGRTPAGDEIALGAHDAEQLAGFGPAPTSYLQAPLYAFRVRTALGALQEKLREAEKRLSEVEDARDEALAELASQKRNELQTNDRFVSLYSGLDKLEQNITRRKRALQAADVEGAQALRDVLAEIDTLNAERIRRTKVCDEKRALLEEADRSIKRHQAALKRIQIEWRNIEARAVNTMGNEMPDELAAQLDVLEEHQVRVRADVDRSIKSFKALKKQLAEAQNNVSLALAEVQRAEGKKEGLLFGYEGEIHECSRALDRALSERRQALANAGRALVDLRGQVPVSASVRRNLLAFDERVLAAARQLALLQRAQSSVDLDAYGTGRTLWIAGFLILVLLIVFAAL